MQPVVVLGDRARGLTVSDVKRTGAAVPHEALFEVTGGGLSAATWVGEYPDFSRLVSFLLDLEKSWRGWSGVRRWESLEGELTITAEHTGSHVTVRVTMARALDWEVTTTFAIGPGEDVTNAALAAATLFD